MNLEDIIPAKKSVHIKVDFGDEIMDAIIYEMDVDYILKVEGGHIRDTSINAVMHNSNLGEDTMKLGLEAIGKLYEEIVRLTYGDRAIEESEKEQLKKK